MQRLFANDLCYLADIASCLTGSKVSNEVANIVDNNTAENAIRPLALGRKNWLFAGSERGARATALFLGLIQSCKACDVNPWKYFDDMLRRVMSHPVNRLRELLPDQWKPLPRDERGLTIPTR